jgi:pyrroloquinoline quinone (PQQ) biosynthesis protein C
VHRSAYQLKEADPHTFALPRLPQGRAKAALLEIQADEYGSNVPANAHAELFSSTMVALDLDPSEGPDLDRLPAVTLTTSTFLNLLGRSRRLAGACLAHLCVFEMTSVEPMASYAAAVRRLVADDTSTAAARFFDVHVAADGYHEQLAVEELLRGLDEDHPDLAADALFGAAGLLVVERDLTEHLLDAWAGGRTSLRAPLDGSSLSPADRTTG